MWWLSGVIYPYANTLKKDYWLSFHWFVSLMSLLFYFNSQSPFWHTLRHRMPWWEIKKKRMLFPVIEVLSVIRCPVLSTQSTVLEEVIESLFFVLWKIDQWKKLTWIAPVWTQTIAVLHDLSLYCVLEQWTAADIFAHRNWGKMRASWK